MSENLKEQNLTSSGLGENMLYYIPMNGRVLVDLYKVIQVNYKLPMYSLNYVSKYFMHKMKNDVSPNEIFIKQKGTSSDRRLIAEYCLIDCVLCNRLMNKLDIITNNVGMSNVCLVPLSYLFLRGQGVKIFSLVANRCRDEGYVVPLIDKNEKEEEGYEGAIVLQPNVNIYFDPVVVADFNSLYPSCMISENLSHESYVTPGSKYDNLLDYDYNDIIYDLYKEEPVAPGRKKMKKVKCGEKVCRFASKKDGSKALLPRILQDLLKARKNTRKEQANFKKNSFEWKVKEGLQSAYKITANSLYGQVGARTSPIYLKDIAACTTAIGRKLIYYTRDFFEKNYEGCKAIYGDSVTGDTPLLLLDNNEIVIKTIETLCKEWSPYEEFKPMDSNRWDKEQGSTRYKAWTSKGWSDIKRVIRHRTKKDIYRITTHAGTVDVTEDHSLLSSNGEIIKTRDAQIGTELLHSYPSFNSEGDKFKKFNFCSKSKVHLAYLYYLHKKMGYACSVDTVDDSFLFFTNNENVDNRIKKIVKIEGNFTGYVYDLETCVGNFQAGIGEIIVKNTDSVFLKFECKDKDGKKLTGLDAMYKSMMYCIEGANVISRQLKAPHNLEFEKAIFPFILITKKRYHGHYYTEYGDDHFDVKSMGIVLKRRDNAPIVKHVFGSVVDIIMKEHDIEKAIKVARNMAEDILNGKYPDDMFVITKSLKSYYKKPNQIAHNVLAGRIGKRDPGNKPQVNDRIPYVYITTNDDSALQGERIETPEFVKNNGLKIDYKFYLTNQISKPVSQIFGLVMPDVSELFSDVIKTYDNKIKGVRQITEFFKVTKIKKTAITYTTTEETSDNDNGDDDIDDVGAYDGCEGLSLFE
jgi:DNA polymerase elongation subunit (family B)